MTLLNATSLKPAAFMLAPHIGGMAGAFVMRNQLPVWYKRLRKPFWTPPDWVFGPVWAGLYTGMGYASWLVYKEVGLYSTPMYLYGAQLALNWAWSPLFFGAHSVGLATLDLLAIAGLVAACARQFQPISAPASRLMLPYLAWMGLALSANVYIWLANDAATLRGDH